MGLEQEIDGLKSRQKLAFLLEYIAENETAEAYYLLGDTYYLMGEVASALAAFQEVQKRDSNYKNTNLLLQIYQSVVEEENTKIELEQTITIANEAELLERFRETMDLDAAIQLIAAYLDHGRVSKAQTLILETLELDTSRPELFHLWARFASEIGDMPRALEYLLLAQENESQHVETAFELVKIYVRLDQRDVADKLYRALVDQITADQNNELLAYLAYARGNYTESLALLDEVEIKQREHLKVLWLENHYNLGKQQWKEKARTWAQAHASSIALRYWHALVHYAANEFEAAVKVIAVDTIDTAYQSSHPIYFLYHLCQVQLHPQSAIWTSGVTAFLNPEKRRWDQDVLGHTALLLADTLHNPPTWSETEWSLVERDLPNSSKDLMTYLLEVQEEPTFKKIPFYLGCIYFEIQQNPQAAIPCFEKTLSKLPEFVLAMQKLILCFEQLDDEEGAMKWRNRLSILQF